jgi:hypothetical protein
MGKQHRQDMRGARVQRAQLATVRNTLQDAHNDRLYSTYTAAHNQAQQDYSVENRRINAMPGTALVKQPLWDGNTLNRDTRQAQAQTTYDAAVAVPMTQKIWPELRRKMDEAIEQQRRAAGKTRLRSARPFENLDIVVSKNGSEYSNPGLLSLITEVLNHTEFLAERCAHVGVYPPGGGTGHAIAIYRQNTGDYQFFDPNFGVYAFATKQKVIDAFEFIFATAYPNLLSASTSDNHSYQDSSGRVKGSWEIFKGTRVPPPVVQQEAPIPVPQPVRQRATEVVNLSAQSQQARTQRVAPIQQNPQTPQPGMQPTSRSPQQTGTPTSSSPLQKFQIDGKWYEAINYKAAREMAKGAK